jgi:lipoate-protein ligase A
MALDEALMAHARRTGDTVLRVYAWSRPTLSLGRNQRARDVYRHDSLAAGGIDVVRRPTGGRALLHDREITYSVTAPSPLESLRASYDEINAILAFALNALGVPVRVAESGGRAAAPTAVPCFAEPARGELMVEGRKLVGSAQWRDRGAMLQHGSILLDDDQSRIPALMHEPVATPPPPATLRDVLRRTPTIAEMSDALFAAVRALADARARALSIDETLLRDMAELIPRYRSDAWTWRR